VSTITIGIEKYRELQAAAAERDRLRTEVLAPHAVDEHGGALMVRARELLDQVEFDNYSFLVRYGHGGVYLQAVFMEPDIVTGVPQLQHTRKWVLSPHMTNSEIVQTVFKLCLTSVEHRARESFKYRGKRIFGPHFDVDALCEIVSERRFDYRVAPVVEGETA
jgi:hypothetical protein